MAVLVDPAIWPFQGEVWAHLVSDVSYDELHDFAQQLGKRRLGFQGDHYDVEAADRVRAVELGALPVESAELLHRLKRAGLRQRNDKPRWQRLEAADHGRALTVPVGLGAAGDRLRTSIGTLGELDLSARSALFADERRAVVLFDWVGPRMSVPELPVDEVWAGAPRRDGERSLELFVEL